MNKENIREEYNKWNEYDEINIHIFPLVRLQILATEHVAVKVNVE